jgi:tRNA-specific 2-thiouridylase
VTGHYARIHRVDDPTEIESGTQTPLLRVAVDQSKDQSYALAALSTRSLRRLRFPLGALNKTQVRELARAAGLSVARKPDSQDLCFLAGTSHRDFLARHGGLNEREGPIVDRDGTELGRHRGAHAFTVGQRHGLGIGGGEPLYVLGTDPHANTVTVGSREKLLTRRLSLCDATLLRDGMVVDGVKVRYRGRRRVCAHLPNTPAGCHQHIDVELIDPMERTAPGQLACLYSGDLIVGHGTIDSL